MILSKKKVVNKRSDMYAIGQVLYVVLSKKNQVYPMQVIEVITKKTLRGEEVSYILQAGSEKSSRVSLDQVDGEVFETAEKVRKTLLQRATLQIGKLVDVATKKSSEWYGSGSEAHAETIHELPDLVTGEDEEIQRGDAYQTVSMPDGTVVKVKLPEIMREAL